MGLSRQELAQKVAVSENVDLTDTREIIDAVFDEIKIRLADGESVKLSGFGIGHAP